MMKPTLIMPETFEDCLTYAKQLHKLYEEYLKVSGGGDSTVITDLQKQMENVTQQINEINNELESLDIPNISENLNDIRTEITEIQNELLTKQNTLTFDNVPTENSNNPVTSTGLYGYLKKMNEDLLHLINQKENSTDVDEKINNIENNYPTNEELTEQLRNYETTTHANETFATKESLSGYETTTHANETFATKESLSGYETTTHATETYATKERLNDYETTAHATETYATKASLNDYETTTHATETYATKSDLQNINLDNYVTKATLDGYETIEHAQNTYATKDEMGNIDLEGYVKTEELTNYETTTHANETFATKESLSGYETTEHATDTYATKASLNDYETTAHATETYATKASLNDYETTEHATDTYATKASLNDYETTAHATETYATKSDLQNVHIVVDDTVSSNSQNAVSSKGIFDFVTDQTADLATVEDLNTKQDTLTFDDTPTLNSPNPATSGGIYDSIKTVKESMNNYTPLTAFDQYKQQVDADYLGKEEASTTYVSQQNLSTELEQYEPKAHAENTYATKLELNNYPTQQYVEGQYATKTELNTKQDLLVFDTVPKLGSTNPVTSEGIYNAIQNSGGDTNYNKLCSVKLRYSDDTNNPNEGYDQTVDILANGKDGDLIRYGYSDFDVQLSNPDYIKHVIFEYLIINEFDIVPYNHVNTSISFPDGEYGPGSGAAICKINSHVYIIDVLSIAFRASDNYIHTVQKSNSKLPNGRFYMHIDNDTFKTLTKGHITYKFTLLI